VGISASILGMKPFACHPGGAHGQSRLMDKYMWRRFFLHRRRSHAAKTGSSKLRNALPRRSANFAFQTRYSHDQDSPGNVKKRFGSSKFFPEKQEIH
jgi:hypothetical protein